MTRIFAISALLFFAVGSMGCVAVSSPAIGWVMDVSGPIMSNGAIGSREGRACAQSIMGVYASGDASIKAAAANGGVTKIASIDHESTWFIVMGEYCTVVRGS
jgi:hypothetical protein